MYATLTRHLNAVVSMFGLTKACLAVAVLVSFHAAAQAPAAELSPRYVEAAVEEAAAGLEQAISSLEAGQFSGVLLVAEGDTILLHKAWGMRDRELELPFTLQTRSELLSITKSFTAALAFRLAADGRIDLDITLGEVFEEFTENKAQITLRQVLSHTAGLPASAPELDRSSATAFILSLNELPLIAEPGTQVVYSNPGYGLAAIVLSRLAGASFQDLIAEEFFEPLAMADSGITNEEAERETAVGYRRDGQGFIELAPPPPRPGTLGATGIVSTPADIFRWHRGLRAWAATDQAFAELFQEVHPGHGYSWTFTRSASGAMRIEKDGEWPSYQAYYAWYPDSDHVLIYLSNSYGWRSDVVTLLETELAL